MKDNTKKSVLMVVLIVAFCAIMAVIDGVLQADYFVKSLIKLVLFLLLPLLYSCYDKDIRIQEIFRAGKNGLKLAVFLCFSVYAVILGGYLLLRNVFDFSAITSALTNNIGVTGEKFIYVSLYISFINSLLEEFFFRGFAFLTLKRLSSRKFAYLFSASVFALYHVAMMIGWFGVGVFVIVMVGLFVGGLIFDYLNEKSGTIYPSWLVHMFANFAINTIGFMLFGMI